jgi:hypothetical protein
MAYVRPVAAVLAAAVICLPALSRAGSISLLDEGIANGGNGPSFIGFVRVVDGAGVGNAKVTATLNGNALVTSSDVLGLYKIPGFGKNVNANDVNIACAKDGYKQANVVRRPHPANDTKDPFEVDCYLQKQ